MMRYQHGHISVLGFLLYLAAVDLRVVSGGPAKAKGSASELYGWLGVDAWDRFPDDIVKAIQEVRPPIPSTEI